jgi:hypothetical protein
LLAEFVVIRFISRIFREDSFRDLPYSVEISSSLTLAQHAAPLQGKNHASKDTPLQRKNHASKDAPLQGKNRFARADWSRG